MTFLEFDDEPEPHALTDDDPLPPVDAPPMRRRRRPLWGEVIGSMGRAARASTKPVDSAKALQARARQEESRRLLEGGKNKGEEKGYGAIADYQPER